MPLTGISLRELVKRKSIRTIDARTRAGLLIIIRSMIRYSLGKKAISENYQLQEQDLAESVQFITMVLFAFRGVL